MLPRFRFASQDFGAHFRDDVIAIRMVEVGPSACGVFKVGIAVIPAVDCVSTTATCIADACCQYRTSVPIQLYSCGGPTPTASRLMASWDLRRGDLDLKTLLRNMVTQSIIHTSKSVH